MISPSASFDEKMKFSEYLKKVLRWEAGRQTSGYDKMLLLTGMYPLPFDVYALRFPVGSEILEHVDTVEKGRHYRFNIILKKSKVGGLFNCSNCIFETNRIKLFRPDISKHSVSKVQEGARYVLSIGWVRGS